MIYFGVFFFLGALAMLHDFWREEGLAKINYWIAYLVLVALAGFRYKVGGDTYNYMYIYDFMPSLGDIYEVDIEKYQPLWVILSAAARSISNEFYVFQIIHAAIINAVIFYFISKNTKYRFTAVLFYYFSLYPYFNFEILRESLAICCFLLSIKYYSSGRWWGYYLYAIIAFLFHVSAILLFVLPFVKRINFNTKTIVAIFVVSSLLNPLVVSYFGSGNFFSQASALEYSDYSYTVWGLISLFLLYVCYPSVIVYLSGDVFGVENDYRNVAKKALLVGSVTPLFFIFFRFLNYFSILYVLLAVEIFHSLRFSRRFQKITPLALSAAFSVFFVFYTAKYFSDTSRLVDSTRWYSHWYPYYSIFDQETDPVREMLIEAERKYQ